MSDEEHDRRDEDEREATVLPAREAMALISPSPGDLDPMSIADDGSAADEEQDPA